MQRFSTDPPRRSSPICPPIRLAACSLERPRNTPTWRALGIGRLDAPGRWVSAASQLDRVARSRRADHTLVGVTGSEHHDVIVVGGGPAGVSCALECFDIQLDTVLVEGASALGGQLPEIAHSVRNVAAGQFGDGSVLQRALQKSATILDDRVYLSHPVTQVDVGDRWIETRGGRWSARALVVATGTRRQDLATAPDGAFGGDVTYALEMQPRRFVGRDVAVIGGGDSATLDALALAGMGSTVKLVHRSEHLTARQDIVRKVHDELAIEELVGWELEALNGTERLEGIQLVRPATGERLPIPVQGLIVKIALRAEYGALQRAA